MFLNSFFKKYWFGLILIAIFAVSSYLNILNAINKHIDDGKNINISGKQRFLSQKIALLASKFSKDKKISEYKEAIKTIASFEENHNYLMNLKLSDKLKKLYEDNNGLNNQTILYIQKATHYFDNQDIESYQYIINNSEKILIHLNKSTEILEQHNSVHRNQLINNALFLLISTIIILLLEAKYIFSPIQKQNKQQAKHLKQINKILQEKMELKTQEVMQLFENVGQHVIISKVDNEGLVTYCSDAFCKMINMQRSGIIGELHPLLTSQKIDQTTLLSVKKKQFNTQIKNIDTQGKISWYDIKINPIQGMHGTLRYLIIYTDITEEVNSKKEKYTLTLTNKKLETLASICSLTSIYNRRIFEELLLKEISLVKRYPRKKASLIFMDIDHFKQVNDKYGHLKGDEILVNFCELLNQELRNSDIFARWGGEEFVVLLKNTDLQEAIKKAELLRQKIEENSISSIYITCSFGVTQLNNTTTVQNVIKEADNMMYIAKERGRNQVIST